MAAETNSEEAVGGSSDASSEPANARGGNGRLRLETAFGDATFAAVGDADMVLRAFEAFKEHDASHHRYRTPAKPPIDTVPPEDQIEDQGGDRGSMEGLPLPAFLNQFQLTTNAERAVAMAVWASRQAGGTKTFTADSLEKVWAGSGQKQPKNVGMELTRAASKGWFNKPARGKFDLVGYGEQAVDKQFPRVAGKK